MVPEFSIKNMKGRDVVKVCEQLTYATGVKVERNILDAMDSGDLESFANTLNLINYLAFKTILILHAEKTALQKEVNAFKN